MLNAETTDVATQRIIKTTVDLSISFKPLELSHTQMTVTLGSSFVVGVSGGSLSVQSGKQPKEFLWFLKLIFKGVSIFLKQTPLRIQKSMR